jgi:hypothetical protein
MRVFTAAQYGIAGFDPATSPATWDSQEVTSTAASATVGSDLVDGTTYRAYVRVSVAGPVYSVWAFTQFTIALDKPATPDLTATGENTSINGPRTLFVLAGHDNILSENQASLETNTTGWEVDANCAIARDTAQAAHGAASLKLTASSAADMSARTLTGTAGVAVLGSKQYTALASFKAGATARSCRVKIKWYDATGALLSTDTGSSATDGTGGFTQAPLTATSPVGAAFAAVIVEVLAAANAEIHYVDKIALSPGAGTTWYRGGTTDTHKFQIEASDDAGITWAQIYGSPFTRDSIYQDLTRYDYTVPPNTQRRYRAKTQITATSGLVVSDASATQNVTLTVTAWWLKDLTDPTLNVELPIFGDAFPTTRPEDQATFRPLGRTRPIVVSDVIRGEEFKLRLYFRGAVAYDDFEAIRAVQRTLLLQSDMTQQWYVRLGAERGTELLHVGGRVSNPRRRVEISAVQVDALS